MPTQAKFFAALLTAILFIIGLPCFAQAFTDDSDHLTVMVWNVERAANNFDQGPEKALQVIRDSGADVVLLQESYDIDGDRPRLGTWLAEQLGWNRYQGESIHLCVLSHLDIEETYFHHTWHGVGAKLKDEHGRVFVAYSIWLDWKGYTPYALRENPELDDDQLLENEVTNSKRLPQVESLLKYIKDQGHMDLEVPLLVGGDFNCPSHLDWTAEAEIERPFVRELPLPVSMAVIEAGFFDAYRSVYPDPVEHPGITWSPLYRVDANGRPLPLDRIDRLYIKQPQGQSVLHLVPDRATVLPEQLEDNDIPKAKRIFPSDHGAVVIRMRWQTGTAVER